MSLDHMWQRLAQHQPYADERGYGPAWAAMCGQRTEMAAWAAAEAAGWAAAQAEAAEGAARAAAWAAAQAEAAAAAASGWAAAQAEAAAAAAAAEVADAVDWIKRSEEEK